MDVKETILEKKRTLEWFLHKRFIIIGIIMGALMVICSVIIVALSFQIRSIYRAAGDHSRDWVVIAGLAFGILAVIIILIVDYILNKMAIKVITKIKVPLDDISNSIQDLSQGRLDTEITYTERDEFGAIADNTTVTIVELKRYINNISEILNQISAKNMDLDVDIEYVGDFLPIKESIETIIMSLNTLLRNMTESMGGIRMGAQNVAETATSLAEGATTQTHEIQDLFAHINTVTGDIIANAQNAEKVAVLANESMKVVKEGNDQMHQMLEAMETIKVQADGISNIIQVINSISEQTQLLALNASIEAARAGEQGKGFAVVADEIGKLASECGEAVDTTNELIGRTIQAVSVGGTLADETAVILKQIVESTAETTQLVGHISEACSKEEGNMKVILQGIESIDDVVSNNAAASEESAAVSEELLALVETLEEQVKEYRLKQEG